MFDLQHLPNAVPGEKIVHFLRRHPITLLPVAFGYLLVTLIPIFGFGYLFIYEPNITHNPVFFPVIILLSSVIFLFAWLILFHMFMDYYLDIWVVTTRRILSIEQTGLFNRIVSELRLYRIQDVTAQINGFLHTVLKFGFLEIQTAGEKTRFVFEEIPRPMTVSKSILELSEVDRREHLDESIENLGGKP